MSIVGEIVELANQAYKIWAAQRNKSTLSPQELFSKFLEPSYNLLKEIHTDYLELYLELQERISLENTLSSETVKWFSRTRSRRQADRSELRSLDIPQLNDKIVKGWNDKHLKELNLAVESYLGNLRNYFLSDETLNNSGNNFLLKTNEDQILYSRSHTRSLLTELWLMRMHLWLELPHEEKIVLLTEEHLQKQLKKSSLPYVHDDFIEGVMKAVVKEEPLPISNIEEVLDSRDKSAIQRINDKPNQEFASPAMKAEIQSILNAITEVPNWRRIIEDHIWAERNNMESAIERVQRSFFRVRILSDR